MSNSYHDVVVTCGDKEYKIIDDSSLMLVCTKAGGWELWSKTPTEETLIGFEFDSVKFKVVTGNVIVCDNEK